MPAEVLFDAIGDGRSGAYQQVTKSRAWTTGARHELQRLLRDARFYDGSIDGKFGTGTTWAIKALYASAKKGDALAQAANKGAGHPKALPVQEEDGTEPLSLSQSETDDLHDLGDLRDLSPAPL